MCVVEKNDEIENCRKGFKIIMSGKWLFWVWDTHDWLFKEVTKSWGLIDNESLERIV